jgi:hypothetical protein
MLACIFGLTESSAISNVVSFFTLEMHERARDGLVHFLRGTPCPSACPYNLLGWASVFWDDTTKSVRRGCISMEVWNLGFEWITYPRSNEELAQTSGGIVCTCSAESIAVRPIHGKGEEYMAREDAKLEARPVLALINLFLRGMSNCAHEKSLSLARKPRRARRRSPWPNSFRSLLPHGPKDTLHGLLAWFRTDLEWRSRTSVTFALDVLILYHPSLIIPHLVVAPEFTYCVVQRTVGLDQDLLKESQTSPDAAMMIRNVIEHMCILMRLLDDFMMLASAIHRRTYHGHDSNNLLLAYQMMNVVCVYLITKVPAEMGGGKDRIRPIYEGVARLGGLLMDDVPGVKHEDTTTTTINSFREQTMQHRYTTSYIYWDRLYRLLRYLDCTRRCDAPRCPLLTAQVLAAPHYMRCTACVRVMYCSRKCQRSAWKNLPHAHRSICNDLRYFSTVVPPRREIPPQLASAIIPAFLPDAAARVLAHFESLFELQMKEANLSH